MATTFKNKVIKDVGLEPITGLSTTSNSRSTIVGLSLANLTEVIVYANVLIKDDTSVEGFYLKEVAIPPNASLRALDAGEKLILSPLNQLVFSSSLDDSIDVIISYVDIV